MHTGCYHHTRHKAEKKPRNAVLNGNNGVLLLENNVFIFSGCGPREWAERMPSCQEPYWKAKGCKHTAATGRAAKRPTREQG